MTDYTIKISFEFFPPKTPESKAKFPEVAKALSIVDPEFFSITFGAGGSTREGTIESVKVLQKETPISVTPHLACLGSTKNELREILQTYKTLGVKRIVALRGDLPSGAVDTGELAYAADLVKLIRDTTGDEFYIEVAAYPEFHPQAKSAEADILNLKRKMDNGANSAITQYFFNPDAYFAFLDQCAKANIFMPITPGIMPITHFGRLVRFSEMCGAEIPLWIRRRLENYGDDAKAVEEFGLEVVYDLCHRLISGGAPGLHFYTLNHADASLALLKMLNYSAQKHILTSPTERGIIT